MDVRGEDRAARPRPFQHDSLVFVSHWVRRESVCLVSRIIQFVCTLRVPSLKMQAALLRCFFRANQV